MERQYNEDDPIAAARLLRFRLRWYAVSTARLLLRRWQALALIVGVASAAGTTPLDNMAMFASPLLGLLAPGHGTAWRFGYLLLLLSACATWAGMQRAQIAGGSFMAFAGSLPFSPRQRRLIDLAVLVLADTPLLMLLAAALAVASRHREPGPQLAALAAFALLALAAQLTLLERRHAAWTGIAAGSLLLAAAIGTPLLLAAAIVTGATAALALALGPRTRRRHAARRPRLPAPAWPARLLRALAGRHAPALQVSLAILYRERIGEVLAKALVAAAIGAAALTLVLLFDGDRRSFGVVLIAQALVALASGGMYRGLHMAHQAARDFTGALPLPPRRHGRFDTAAVLAFGLPVLAGLAALAMAAGTAPLRALAGLASYSILLCALRAPALFSERHAIVLCTVLAGCWCAATVAWLI